MKVYKVLNNAVGTYIIFLIGKLKIYMLIRCLGNSGI